MGGCVGGGGSGAFGDPRMKMYYHTPVQPPPSTHTHQYPILNDSSLLRRIFVVIKVMKYTRNQQSGMTFHLDDDT